MATTKKRGVSGEKVKTDPAFERTRENMAEFTRGGKAAGLLRGAFREILINIPDKGMSKRLVKRFMKVIATDPVNGRGDRTVNHGELLMLKGFDFNDYTPLKETLFVRPVFIFDRATGQVTAHMPDFIPRKMINAGYMTTHFSVTVAAVAVDFEKEHYDHAIMTTDELAWDIEKLPAFDISLALPANSPNPVIVALGIEFFQKVNTRKYILKSGEFNTSAVVNVFMPGTQNA
jgi:hypothetical protein